LIPRRRMPHRESLPGSRPRACDRGSLLLLPGFPSGEGGTTARPPRQALEEEEEEEEVEEVEEEARKNLL
jgi:hypothetical protein